MTHFDQNVFQEAFRDCILPPAERQALLTRLSGDHALVELTFNETRLIDISRWNHDSTPSVKGWYMYLRQYGSKSEVGEFFVNPDGTLAHGTIQLGIMTRERSATDEDFGAACAALKHEEVIRDMAKLFNS